MVDVDIKLHRHFLLSGISGQKLFCLLKINPAKDIIFKRQPFRIIFAVDTSGSMRDSADKNIAGQMRALTEKAKMDILIESFVNLFNSQILKEGDKLSIVKFDDAPKVLIPFTDVENKEVLINAVKSLKKYSGGTNMGAGMKAALELFLKEKGYNRMFLFTDGNTFDEDLTLEMSEEFAKNKIPITAIGIGDDWNFNFINLLADRTRGKVLYALADNGSDAYSSDIKMGELTDMLISELKHSFNEIVANIVLNVNAAKGVAVERISRVYPVQSELDLSLKPYFLGNAEAGDITVFLIEMTVSAHNPGKARLAQINLTYDAGGASYRGETPFMEVIAEFGREYGQSLSVDNEVMQYVQQRNLDRIIDRAVEESKTNINKAVEILKAAMQSVNRMNNAQMTKVLDNAVNELQNKKTIREGTLTALKVSAKTHTVRYGKEIFTDEEIKKITGI